MRMNQTQNDSEMSTENSPGEINDSVKIYSATHINDYNVNQMSNTEERLNVNQMSDTA